MRAAIFYPEVFSRCRWSGIGRRGVVLAVLVSLLAYLATCAVEAVVLPGPAPAVAQTSAHHGHAPDDPEQVDCCAGLQDVSVSARQKNILPSLSGIAAPFFLPSLFSLSSVAGPGRAAPPADPPRLHGRLRLDSTLRPRAPPR